MCTPLLSFVAAPLKTVFPKKGSLFSQGWCGASGLNIDIGAQFGNLASFRVGTHMEDGRFSDLNETGNTSFCKNIFPNEQ